MCLIQGELKFFPNKQKKRFGISFPRRILPRNFSFAPSLMPILEMRLKWWLKIRPSKRMLSQKPYARSNFSKNQSKLLSLISFARRQERCRENCRQKICDDFWVNFCGEKSQLLRNAD